MGLEVFLSLTSGARHVGGDSAEGKLQLVSRARL